MPLIPDPRSQLAKNFREGMDLTDIMPGPMGMAAKMSSPAVDVLSRWIRRFRKDKPPTVPLKNIEKALKNEYQRRTQLGLEETKINDPRMAGQWHHPIEQRSYMGPENLPVGSVGTGREGLIHRPLGAQEKEPFDQLWKFSRELKHQKFADEFSRLVGLPGPLGEITRSFVRKGPREVFSEELARNWRKK